ncbi:hypothetical protein, partial [Burkholderia sp. SIMBA_024]|uniref:hypothetical protein n=1 Tax=Burkholderia sp. SIMBA_024 TaxID=3085768 RepID=UPI00397DF1F3
LTSDFTVNAADAGKGWLAPGNGDWAITTQGASNPVASLIKVNEKAMLQVIADNKASTGALTFEFDALNQDDPTLENPDNIASVSLWGFNDT